MTSPSSDTASAPFVVFDCDGTLVDSQRGIILSVRAALEQEGLPLPSDEFIRRGVGLRLDAGLARLAPDADAETLARIVETYRNAFFEIRQSPDHQEPLYDGAADSIASLAQAGCLLGIATGKSRRGLLATLERHGLMDAFVVLKTADDGPGKPDPTILRDAILEAGAASETTVMIGDTSFDIAMARAARVYAIGVGWGYHPVEELARAGADALIEDYAELAPAVRRAMKGLIT